MNPFSDVLSAAESADLVAQVAHLTSAGLPLSPGLRAAAEEVPTGRLASAFRGLADRLDSGQALVESIVGMKHQLPTYVQGMVLAGIASGDPLGALDEFVTHRQRVSAFQRRVWATLAYPTLLLVLVIVVGGFTLLIVGEQLSEIAETFDIVLPAPTVMLVWLAENGWPVLASLVPGMLAAIVLLTIFRRNTLVRSLLAQVPLIGPVWWNGSLSEFCRLLALLIDRKVTMPAALDLTATAIGDASLAHGCRKLAKQVQAGLPASEALSGIPQFPAVLRPLVAWGEYTSSVAESLRAASALFEERARSRLALLQSALPPVIFFFIVTLVGFMLSAVLLPLVRLFQLFAYLL
jgi:type IV pilus assembly protein PilC